MKKSIKFILLVALVIISGSITTGCYMFGTYTFRGNTATLTLATEETVTVTVSGNTLTGTYEGMSFTLTRSSHSPNRGSNPFVGTWTNTSEGFSAIVNDTDWILFMHDLSKLDFSF